MSEEQKSTAVVVPLKAGGRVSGIIPQTIEETFRLAQAIAKSGLAPRGMDKPESIMVAIMHGAEIGLPPMQSLQRIAVVNGRPTVWGDGLPALLWARGFSIQERIEESTAFCTVIRPGGEAITRSFSVADAKKAGLWGKAGPWTQYPDRMLQMRARGFACRDGAADVLGGLYITEEAEDIIDVSPAPPKRVVGRDREGRKTAYAAKNDGDEEMFNEIRAQIACAQTAEEIENLRKTYKTELADLPRAWIEIVEAEIADTGLIKDAAE